MRASPFGSGSDIGAIRVVPETEEILAVSLEGEFDLTNAPCLSDEIERALDRGNGLIVDLSEATFIDSSVIHVLMRRRPEEPEASGVVGCPDVQLPVQRELTSTSSTSFRREPRRTSSEGSMRLWSAAREEAVSRAPLELR